MKAKDIMTSPVVSVTPVTSVREIAALLLEHRISAVPVLDDGRLVGIVSEGDLLHRHEIGTDRVPPPRSWWLRLFSTGGTPAEYVRSHAAHARDIMAREVVSVAEDTPVADIARLLETRGIKRVPVMRDAQVVGIVSRANLVQALALARGPKRRVREPSDQAIRARLLAELESQPWWARTGSNVIVTDGVVHYWGFVGAVNERHAARIAAENVPGVRAIEDHRLEYRYMSSMS